MWVICFLLFFLLNQISGSFQNQVQFAFLSVLLVDLLGRTIYGNNDPVQTAFDGFFRIFGIHKMTIGGGNGVNAFAFGILYHFQKFWIDVWFALKIKNQIDQIIGQLINGVFEKVRFKVSCFARKAPQTARAFRATEVTSGSWFKGYGEWVAPMNLPA